jgi:hypothetical protein
MLLIFIFEASDYVAAVLIHEENLFDTSLKGIDGDLGLAQRLSPAFEDQITLLSFPNGPN